MLALKEKQKVAVIINRCSCGKVSDLGYIEYFESNMCSECLNEFERFNNETIDPITLDSYQVTDIKANHIEIEKDLQALPF
jgi:hypothetical protein